MRHHGYGLAAVLIIAAFIVLAARSRAAADIFGRLFMSEITGDASADHSAQGQVLHAGPIRMKFVDGQLRYIRVGDKEIVRRIYFGVRDGNWETAMPAYSKMDVDAADDHFTVHLAADCKLGAVDYSWTGTIVGTADGKITFTAEGSAGNDFESNRIGLCVLYGKASLAGQDFETDGPIGAAQFPQLVAPKLVAEKFHKLQYSTAAGLHVSCSLEGATFDMEDQRNWGDSSWKAYAPLPYAYKHVGKGDRKSETITLTVAGATEGKATPQDPVRVKIGQAIEGAKLPAFTTSSTPDKGGFSGMNFDRAHNASKPRIEWECIPTTHLPDDDTIMENVPAVSDQAKTVRGYNANCKIAVGPIHIPGKKNDQPIATAWGIAMVKSLGIGGVDEANFALGRDATAALDAVAPYAGQKLIQVDTVPADSHHLIAFASANAKGTGLFLVNRTAHACHVEIDGLGAAPVNVLCVGPNATDNQDAVSGGSLNLTIEAYGVYRVTMAK